SLNKEQQIAFDKIVTEVFSDGGGMFFIDGPGGTGKTYLYKALLSAVRSKNCIALATASSGVAASLLPGGRTAHSRFKIPLEISNNMTCSISKQCALASLLRMTKLIIWDEAPMLHRYTIEAVDNMLRDINECNLPFGGKVVVLGGDFRQILPVIKKGNKTDIMQACLVYSHLWSHFIKFELVQNMRAQLDPIFSKFLLSIGNGVEKLHTCNMIQLSPEITICFENEVVSLKNLIHAVFPDLNNYTDDLNAVINRVILTPKNEYVDQINNILLKDIPGKTFTYYSFDETLEETQQSIHEDFLNTLTPNGIPPHELILKQNCPVMLLRNINPSEGLCNGTRLICRRFERNVIDAEVANGEYRGKRVFLPRIPFIPLQSDKNSFPFKRTQFPIRPCFAMTINKAQVNMDNNFQLIRDISAGASGWTAKVVVAEKSSPKNFRTGSGKYQKIVLMDSEDVGTNILDFIRTTIENDKVFYIKAVQKEPNSAQYKYDVIFMLDPISSTTDDTDEFSDKGKGISSCLSDEGTSSVLTAKRSLLQSLETVVPTKKKIEQHSDGTKSKK
ncbi:ATP-dependent DNA helicase PIF1-like, partial [Olea europaea subsp. europaea]